MNTIEKIESLVKQNSKKIMAIPASKEDLQDQIKCIEEEIESGYSEISDIEDTISHLKNELGQLKEQVKTAPSGNLTKAEAEALQDEQRRLTNYLNDMKKRQAA